MLAGSYIRSELMVFVHDMSASISCNFNPIWARRISFFTRCLASRFAPLGLRFTRLQGFALRAMRTWRPGWRIMGVQQRTALIAYAFRRDREIHPFGHKQIVWMGFIC